MKLTPEILSDLIQDTPSLAGPRRYVVAFSGGLDSTVLLDLARRALPAHDGASLLAVHVNHRLAPDSDAWQQGCIKVAAAMGVRIRPIVVDATPGSGQSPEEAARIARYGALHSCLQAADVLMTAHHQDDQLETVLLQLLRGAGPDGLAAMSRVQTAKVHDGLFFHVRPLLGVGRDRIRAYATQRGLTWIEDPGNASAGPDRNYIRHRIVPMLRERWPSAATSISRSARHCAAASELLSDLGLSDLQATVDEQGRLRVADLLSLSSSRQANLLRSWIREKGLAMPTEAHIERCLQDLLRATSDTQPCVRWADVAVRRWRELLYAHRAIRIPSPGYCVALEAARPLRLPAGLGQLVLRQVTGRGIGVECQEDLQVRFREGGESLRPHVNRPDRPLKKLLQEAAIVPWMRAAIPLVYAGDRLVAVADLWTDCACAAAAGEPGLLVQWEQRPSLY